MLLSRFIMRPKYALKLAIIAIGLLLSIYIGGMIGALPNTGVNFIDNMAMHRSYVDITKSAIHAKLSEETAKDIPAHASVNSDRYQTTGYERADFLRQACLYTKVNVNRGRVRVSYDSKFKVLYCPLCKIASTFWTRVFKMVKLNSNGMSKRVSTPFDVPISEAPRSELYYDKASGSVTGLGDARDAFKFLFVRNPFGMLFSAYVDKIVGPNPTFWKGFGIPAVRNARHRHSNVCGSDVTFEEFLRYIVVVHKSHRNLDCHVDHFDSCQPCQMNYTYVATMETFKEDTFHILKHLNQTETLDEFETKFSDLHAYDAIDDSTSGPFSWKADITRCMSWHEALQRIWRKLQIRGIISNTEVFSLTEDESKKITRNGFIEVLLAARQQSSAFDRNKQKKDEYLEAYRHVPVDVLDDVRLVYEREFKLFNYDDRPKELFDRDEA